MSKYSTIADTLREEIQSGVYTQSGKLPTEYELVTRFGVSRQTIRQAISSLKNNGIVYQVQGSGTYITKPTAKRVYSGLARNIMVMCTYISDYIFPSIVRGIEATFNGSGYRMHLASTGNKVDVERKILQEVMQEQDIDGMIVEGSKTGFPNPNISLYKEIEEMGIPVVFLHCSYQELPQSVVVGMKDYEGGRLAAAKLVKEGCRKIFGIFKSDDRQGLQRYAGYTDGILEAGLGLDSSEVRWYTTEDMQDRGVHINPLTAEAFKKASADGIICYNDLVATAVIRDFSKYGIPIPELVSFDDSYLCKAAPIPFVSLGHRKEELGALAAKKIKSIIEGNKEESVYLDWII